MTLLSELPDEIKTYLAKLIGEDRDAHIDHIDWLATMKTTPERIRHKAECEAAIALATKAQEFFPLPPDLERPDAADEASPQ